MAVLMIGRMRGPTHELLAASEEVERGLGTPVGLLARVVAPSEDGIVLVNLWASEDARRASDDDPVHREVVQKSGIAGLVEETTIDRYETAHLDFAVR